MKGGFWAAWFQNPNPEWLYHAVLQPLTQMNRQVRNLQDRHRVHGREWRETRLGRLETITSGIALCARLGVQYWGPSFVEDAFQATQHTYIFLPAMCRGMPVWFRKKDT